MGRGKKSIPEKRQSLIFFVLNNGARRGFEMLRVCGKSNADTYNLIRGLFERCVWIFVCVTVVPDSFQNREGLKGAICFLFVCFFF